MVVEKKPKELGKSRAKTEKIEGANGYSFLSFFFFFSCTSLFLSFFPHLFSFLFFRDNGLLTKGVMLVGNSLKVINAFIIVQASCSWVTGSLSILEGIYSSINSFTFLYLC